MQQLNYQISKKRTDDPVGILVGRNAIQKQKSQGDDKLESIKLI
jgi:hypothetical protein